MRVMRSAFAGLCVAAFALPALAQSRPVADVDPTGDTEVIDFFLPGKFKQAMARAKELKRPILIKGVAFGVDKEGAVCATKGHW